MGSKLALWGVVAVLTTAAACSQRDEGILGPDFHTPPAAAGSSAGPTGFAGTTGTSGPTDAGEPMDAANPPEVPFEIDAGPIDPGLTKVAASNGCGKDAGLAPGMFVRRTVQTMGTKPDDAADSKKGPWTYEREYFIKLPRTYQAGQVLPLVIEGPSCGGQGTNLFQVNDRLNATPPVIVVGVTPPPNAIGQSPNPNQGCFDTNDGDVSVDWPFYEAMYDALAEEVCFDRNRVFAMGHTSGGTFANELACKYAGDEARPIRGVISSQGALPTDAKARPTCSSKPLAGMWVHDTMNVTTPIDRAKQTITRAMQVNGCAVTRYEDATFEPFQLPGQDPWCRRIRGCPAATPLVVCLLPGIGRYSHDDVVVPGTLKFIDMFQVAPLLTQ
jgi:poly(3-hydroxybutyrate) depolymerase